VVDAMLEFVRDVRYRQEAQLLVVALQLASAARPRSMSARSLNDLKGRPLIETLVRRFTPDKWAVWSFPTPRLDRQPPNSEISRSTPHRACRSLRAPRITRLAVSTHVDTVPELRRPAWMAESDRRLLRDDD
jgi:hypothetical protein